MLDVMFKERTFSSKCPTTPLFLTNCQTCQTEQISLGEQVEPGFVSEGGEKRVNETIILQGNRIGVGEDSRGWRCCFFWHLVIQAATPHDCPIAYRRSVRARAHAAPVWRK